MWISIAKIVVCFYFFILTTAAYRTKIDDRFVPRKTITTTPPPPSLEQDNRDSLIKVRHHSRFPNLDRVMTKIEGMNGKISSGDSSVHKRTWRRITTTTPPPTTESEDLFEDYGDFEYEDEEKNDDNENYPWMGDEEDEEDDEENSDNYLEDWQAEEPTERPTPAPQTRKLSPISEMKWERYGTRAKVEESRRIEKKSNDEMSVTLARNHFIRVRFEGHCKKPLPKVIPVQKEHPDTSKKYTPHCTVLHRCSEDTGCCGQHHMICGPKTQVSVNLYFYTQSLGVLQSKVEKLSFLNHTECACMEKNSDTVSTVTPTKMNLKSADLRFYHEPENIRRCNCPEEFTAMYKYGAPCTCDCEEENQDCIRMQKGKEYFSLTDRKCILDDKCGTPKCEYGSYIKEKGRCPRKPERLDSSESSYNL